MRILIAPDSFKGALSSVEAAAVMAAAAEKLFSGKDIRQIPLSDGGEGFTAALVRAAGGREESVTVHDPLMRPTEAVLGLLDHDRTAVIEMASASGMERLDAGERNPWITSTYGTGELIRAALDRRCRRILIGVGGSATVDGGVGAIQALGGRFLDGYGHELPPGGGALQRLEKIDLSSLDKRLKETTLEVACDVTNPFTGPEGAATVYAPQKGADAVMTRKLERGLLRLAARIRDDLGRDIAGLPHAGAAGGLAGGLAACLGAHLLPGFEVVSRITGLPKWIRNTDLILTGEGHTDRQTLYGKAPYALAQLAGRHGVPVILLTGGVDLDAADDLLESFTAIAPINPALLPLGKALAATERHLRFAVQQTLQTALAGYRIKRKKGSSRST